MSASAMDALLATVVWRCTLCGGTAACDCWARERARAAEHERRALAYICKVAQTCGCQVDHLGGVAAACGCSPVCDCHMSEDEAYAAAERLGLGSPT